MRIKDLSIALRASACVVALISAAAHAEQISAPKAPVAETADADGDIVVTAQKRVERQQDVPVSVTVLSGEAFQAKAIRNLQELAGAVPAVTIAHAGPLDRKFVRGIGTGDNPAFDSVVGTFVDDVYHGRSRTTSSGLFDLERAEFLKGPQSTYFGNSAIAGAVNMSTVKPGDTASGYLFGSYNFDFKQYTLEGAYGGPITDTLSARVSGVVGSGDGYIYDTGSRSHIPETNDRALRGQLRWTPSEELTVNLKAEVGRFLQKGGPLLQPSKGCPPTIAAPGVNGFPATIRPFCAYALSHGEDVAFNHVRTTDGKDFSNLWTQEYQATIDYNVGGATLSSNTAYYKYKYRMQFDIDFTSGLFQVSGAPEDYNQFSQEFRLTSAPGKTIEYVVGLYYQRDRIDGFQNYTFYTLLPTAAQIAANPAFASVAANAPFGQESKFNQLERMYAAFGSLKLNVTDALSVTGGVRAQIVRKSLAKAIFYGTGPGYGTQEVMPFAGANAYGQALGLGPAVAANYSRKDEQITPSAIAQYKIDRDVMLYGSYSRGWQSGGFNFVDSSPLQDQVPFAPEKVDAFELGLKSQLFNRHLTFNVTGFYSKYSNLQVGGNRQGESIPIPVVNNAGAAISKGVELETNWRVSRQFTTGVNFTYLRAYYSKYPNATPLPCQAIVGQCVFGATTPVSTTQDLSGARTPYAPRYSGNWTTSFTQPLNDGLDLVLGSVMAFTGRYAASFNNDPNAFQSAFVKLDLSARIVDEAAKWEVAFLVKNVTDRKTSQYISGWPSTAGSYLSQIDPPRSFTLQFRKGF